MDRKVLATSGIARMNLLLHGIEDFNRVFEETRTQATDFPGVRRLRTWTG